MKKDDIAIIISMAGLSKRFSDAGYIVPKYMLEIFGETVFENAVRSFSKYFKSNDFIFIARPLCDTGRFIEEKCQKLGIISHNTIILDLTTGGQAETVFIGLINCSINENKPILIFNIDTFRPNYSFPADIEKWDGYLEVFYGSGPNWSYARPLNKNSTRVIETAEKVEISNLCSTGLYYFKSFEIFKKAYNGYYQEITTKELYVAPLYNSLISSDYQIHYFLIERKEVIFCGTPEEYRSLLMIKK
jgi:NDP-sugar pyrophosphorylase family protein